MTVLESATLYYMYVATPLIILKNTALSRLHTLIQVLHFWLG